MYSRKINVAKFKKGVQNQKSFTDGHICTYIVSQYLGATSLSFSTAAVLVRVPSVRNRDHLLVTVPERDPDEGHQPDVDFINHDYQPNQSTHFIFLGTQNLESMLRSQFSRIFENFRGFLTIFGEKKIGVFLNKQCYVQIFSNQAEI
jgi:hypothetical protein